MAGLERLKDTILDRPQRRPDNSVPSLLSVGRQETAIGILENNKGVWVFEKILFRQTGISRVKTTLK